MSETALSLAPAPPAAGLAALGEVKLSPAAEQRLAHVRATAGGPAAWRLRKAAEARDLFALAEISGRLEIEWFDASTDLRMAVLLRAPVPVRGPQPDAPLEIGSFVRLGLTYRQEVMTLPQAGFSFVQILAPRGVWHPNVSRDDIQAVCLGPHLPISIPLREILLLTYHGALTMEGVQFSASDPAGVLNPAASDWWQQNVHRLPLSREPFIARSTSKP